MTRPDTSMGDVFALLYDALPPGWSIRFWKFKPLWADEEAKVNRGYTTVVFIYDENGCEILHEKHLETFPLTWWGPVIESIREIADSPVVPQGGSDEQEATEAPEPGGSGDDPDLSVAAGPEQEAPSESSGV